MAFLKLNNKKIYYEVHGDGEPLVILNGIMMSHKSWVAFIPELSKKYKVILLDFLDQGNSDKMDSSYKQDLQVEVVKAVLDELKINNANILGISYGGEVGLQFVLKYKKYVNKLLLFNTTSYTNPWLEDIGRGWINTAKYNDPEAFYNVTIPIIYSQNFYEKNIDWMNRRKAILEKIFNKEFLQGVIRLTESAEGYDVRNKLCEIEQDTIIISSEFDYITPISNQEYIHNNVKNSKYILIKNCGHASMYEKPMEFLSIVFGFLTIENEIKIL